MKSIMLVNSFDDIRNKPDIIVIGRFALYNFHKDGLYEELWERAVIDDKKMVSMVDNFKWRDLAETSQILDSIDRGEMVVLFNAHQAARMIRLNPDKSLFLVPEMLYPTYTTIFVSKKVKFYDQIVIK